MHLRVSDVEHLKGAIFFYIIMVRFFGIIAPAYSRVRYRSPNFCPFVRPSVRPSTFTSKFGFLDIRDSCESETLHSNCP